MPRKTEPMGNVDAAWLSMDDPTNLMMVTGVMTFKKPIDYDHFMAVVRYRWLKFDRFRQRIVRPRSPVGTPYWEEDPHFNIEAHLRRVALPAPGDKEALQRMVSELMSTPLDYAKPLWQVHIIENYGEGCAILSRIHHAIADGMALIFVLLSLTDMTPDAPWPEPEDEKGTKENDILDGPLSALLKQGYSTARTMSKITGKVLDETRQSLNDYNHLLQLLQTGADASYAATRLLLLTTDPPTPFKGQLGVMKHAAWSQPLPLRDIKSIKSATRTTVNDVLVSAMTGALRRYLIERGENPQDFRAVVPVNMRRPDEMGELGNKFGLVFLTLPVHIGDPIKRLDEVHRRMANLKDSSEAVVALGILNAMGVSPTEIQSLILRTFATKATTVMTNVPGPPVPLFLAGREIDSIMFWVPQSGRLGMGVSILSYAGNVYLGIAADAHLVPDPERIVLGFHDEYSLLMESTRLEREALALARRKRLRAAPPPPPKPKPGETEPAPEQETQTPAEPDDFTKINGIGPKIARVLAENGILTYAQLAKTQPEQLRIVLNGAGGRYRNIDPVTWPEQARYLASL